MLASPFSCHSSGRSHCGCLLIGSFLAGGGQVLTPLPSHLGGDTGRNCSRRWSSVRSPLRGYLVMFSAVTSLPRLTLPFGWCCEKGVHDAEHVSAHGRKTLLSPHSLLSWSFRSRGIIVVFLIGLFAACSQVHRSRCRQGLPCGCAVFVHLAPVRQFSRQLELFRMRPSVSVLVPRFHAPCFLFQRELCSSLSVFCD